MAPRITLKVYCNFQDYGSYVEYTITTTSRDISIPVACRRNNMTHLMRFIYWDRDMWDWIYTPNGELLVEKNYFITGAPFEK